MGSRTATLSTGPFWGPLVGLTLGLALMACRSDAGMACRDDTIWLRGDFGKARFSVDVADEAGERSQGLMFVEQMPASKGMLFVYEQPQQVAFWMKNTLIPLDILFADARGVIVKVQANAVPGDLTPLPGGGKVQYVLEINGGTAAKMGIEPGVELRHPAIGQAAWPCE